MNTSRLQKRPKLDPIGRFYNSSASKEQISAVKNLSEWLETATSKSEYLLFLEGIDANKVFVVPFLNVLVHLKANDPILRKAIELNILKPKNNG